MSDQIDCKIVTLVECMMMGGAALTGVAAGAFDGKRVVVFQFKGKRKAGEFPQYGMLLEDAEYLRTCLGEAIGKERKKQEP